MKFISSLLYGFKSFLLYIMEESSENCFKKLIESMGIESYDPLLVAALNEYSRRKTFQ